MSSSALPRLAFIVLAHKQPEQVVRLARLLSPAFCFVHVDSSVLAAEYARFTALLAAVPGAHLLAPRVRSRWASWGIVEAVMLGVRRAIALDVDHLVLMSGQDLPLVPRSRLESFSARHADRSFLASWELPWTPWGRRGGMERLEQWHMPVAGRRCRLPWRRRLPAGLTPYGGSLYWMLSRAAAQELLRTHDARPDLQRFFRHTWIPDELYVPTLVLSQPVHEVVNENLWYIDWEPDSSHPRLLGTSDLPELIDASEHGSGVGGQAGQKLFARKFDVEIDGDIVSALEARAINT